jgi:hypothetical protein
MTTRAWNLGDLGEHFPALDLCPSETQCHKYLAQATTLNDAGGQLLKSHLGLVLLTNNFLLLALITPGAPLSRRETAGYVNQRGADTWLTSFLYRKDQSRRGVLMRAGEASYCRHIFECLYKHIEEKRCSAGQNTGLFGIVPSN